MLSFLLLAACGPGSIRLEQDVSTPDSRDTGAEDTGDTAETGDTGIDTDSAVDTDSGTDTDTGENTDTAEDTDSGSDTAEDTEETGDTAPIDTGEPPPCEGIAVTYSDLYFNSLTSEADLGIIGCATGIVTDVGGHAWMAATVPAEVDGADNVRVVVSIASSAEGFFYIRDDQGDSILVSVHVTR